MAEPATRLPSLPGGFLLSLAAEGLYRPLWSDAILDELHEHEAQKLVTRGASHAEALTRTAYLIGRMRSAFDDALVTGWEPLEGSFGLPDLDDEHVVAAALVGGAGVIVTDNMKHFPVDRLPGHIDVQTARDFAAHTASVDPARAARALVEISRRHCNPRHSPQELLDLLVSRYAMDDVADLVRPVLGDRHWHEEWK